MKTKLFSLLPLILLFAAHAFSQIQSVKIVPKKVVYKRETDVSYKKKFTIIYPKAALNSNPALKRKIEESLNYEKIFEFDLKKELDTTDMLVDEIGYRVLYNRNGILNLMLSADFSAAHESHSDKSIVISLKTGEIVKPEDIFIKTKLAALAKLIDKSMQAEIGRTLRDIRKTYGDNDYQYVKEQFGADRAFEIDDLREFKISQKGVTFHYNYYFSHISRNFQPPGEFFLSYARLKLFIRRDGLLERLAR